MFWVALPDDFPLCRNELLQQMAGAGISARRGIMAAHLEPAHAGEPHGPLAVTERLTASSVILPLFHRMTEAEQAHVAGTILDAARRAPARTG